MIYLGFLTGIWFMFGGSEIAIAGSQMRKFHLIAQGVGMQTIQYEQATRSIEGWFIMFFGISVGMLGYYILYESIKYGISNRGFSC